MEDEIIPESWWKRNRKWAIPTGGCLGLVIILLGFMIYGIYSVSHKLAEETSLFARVKVVPKIYKDPKVTEALGEIIEVEENKNYEGEDHKNYFEIEMLVEGSMDSGVVKVIGRRVGDQWEFETFELSVNGTGEVIDLTDPVD